MGKTRGVPGFDVDELVAQCVAANQESEPRLAVRDAIAAGLADRTGVADALRPTEGGITLLHHTPEFTIIHVVWAPGMTLYPHDHRMWAVIGIYGGQEDNAFYRRTGPGERTLVETGGKQLGEGDLIVLGDDTIHSVTNPLTRLTGAIHAYGGDFVNQPRSMWGPGPREERPHDMAETNRQFAEANAAWERA
jgi:predicted metal-dependent enzyme (double-stranded beta helix superfamily)